MKFRRATMPQVYPLRYVEDFGANYKFIRLSSLKCCGSVRCMLYISDRGKTAGLAPVRNICEPSNGFRNGWFMTFASGSFKFGYSEGYFYRVFKKMVGILPVSYLTSVRLKQAMKWLYHTLICLLLKSQKIQVSPIKRILVGVSKKKLG